MNKIDLPANCAMLNENEQMEAIGGGTVDTAVKAAAVIGGAAALIGVAATAVSVLFSGNPFSWIQGTINAGKNFIEGSQNAGQNFLNGLLGISQL